MSYLHVSPEHFSGGVIARPEKKALVAWRPLRWPPAIGTACLAPPSASLSRLSDQEEALPSPDASKESGRTERID